MKTLLLFATIILGSSVVLNTIAPKPNSDTNTATSIEQLKQSKSITKVYLSNLALEVVPGELKQHQAVEKLILANNFITTLPEFIKDFNSLTYLDLSKNKTIDLDQALEQLKGIKLKTLNLSACNLVYIPFKIGKIKSIKSLDLSNNHLIDLPFYLGKLKKLEYLNLSNNEITSLDFGVWKCKNLKFIDLSGIRDLDMKNVCMNLQTLNQLQTVSVSYVIDTLPEEFGLINTRQWAFDNSTLSYFPESLNQNKTLDELTFESCEGSDFNQIAPTIAKIKSLTKLRISSSINEIPEALKTVQQITSLDLSHNDLTSLPISDEDFPNLTELVLYGNNFSPEEWQKIRANFPNCNLVSNNIPTAVEDIAIPDGETSIQPPLAQVTLPINKEVINTKQTNKLSFEDTEINIPADAFVDANGNKITTPVTIEYTQYDDPLEIFLSGIPMKYDSAGISTYFQSAGMFDLNATSNGEEVYLASDMQIEVEFESTTSEEGFNLYSLDKKTGEWSYQEPAPLDAKNQSLNNEFNNINQPISYKLSPVLIKPQLYCQDIGIRIEKHKGRYFYKIISKTPNGANNEYLEIPVYLRKPNLFAPLDQKECRKSKRFFRKYYGHGIESDGAKPAHEITFDLNKDLDCYKLTIVHLDTILEINMKLAKYSPNFEKEQKANKIFWKKLDKSVEKTKENNTAAVQVYESKMVQYEMALKNKENEVRYSLGRSSGFKMPKKRTLILAKLALWNTDKIPKYNKPETLDLKFEDGEGERIVASKVVALNFTKNSVSYSKSGKILFEKNNRIGLVVIAKDKIAYIGQKEFAKISALNKKTARVQVDLLDQDSMDYKSLQSYIY